VKFDVRCNGNQDQTQSGKLLKGEETIDKEGII
jgi:hypothetical protein